MVEDGAARFREVAEKWLQGFALALSDKDANAASSLFHPDGWLRDVLVFSWDSRSLQGRTRIQEYLEGCLKITTFEHGSFAIDESSGLAPSLFKLAEEYNGIEAAFSFRTPAIDGRGFIRLVTDENEESGERKWEALSVFITPGDIRGHEENLYDYGIYGDHTLTWNEVNAARVAEVEKDPYALVSTSISPSLPSTQDY